MSESAREIERVILWGFMASGKSAVGSALAGRLGWEHIDLDTEIERRDGRPVARIFAEGGEPFFRRLEVEASRDLIRRTHAVFSCGGGWVTNPESRTLVPPRSLTVWLKVSPEVALARAATEGGGTRRPLLAGDDPEGTVLRLLGVREPLYGRADLMIQTDTRDAANIASEIEARIRGRVTERPHSSPRTEYGEG